MPSYKRKDGNYPVISSSGVSGYHSEFKAEGEGLITGRYGTLGEVYYVNGRYWPHNTALYVTNFKGNYPKYVYFLLKHLGNLKTSDKSTVPGVNRNDLHEIMVPYIEPKLQKPIADCLFQLEEKIRLNDQIKTDLESIAKTLYDYWFVQFDFPDANGKPYNSSGGEMVYNKSLKREIPIEWKVKKLKNVTNLSLGGTPDTNMSEYWDGGTIPWASSAETAQFPLISTEKSITVEGVTNSPAKLHEKGTVLLSIVRYLRPSILGIRAAFNQSVVGIQGTDELQSAYIYNAVKAHVPIFLTRRTGAQQPHINLNEVENMPIILPQKQALDKFYAIANPIYDAILSLSHQTQKLSQFSDWLLPMLMNGQVVVTTAAAADLPVTAIYEQAETTLIAAAE